MSNAQIHRSSAYWEMGLEALDFKNYVAVNYTLIRKYGLHVAVLVGELASEARYYKNKGQLEDGWFFSTVENIENHTGLNAYYQRESIKAMQDLGIVETKYSGLPRKRYFRVDAMRIIEEMSDAEETAVDRQSFTQLTTSDQHSEQLEAYPVNDNNCNKQPKQTTKKKERKKPAETFDSIIAEKTNNEDLRTALMEFVRMRQRIKKPLTNYALKLRLNKLWKLGKTDEERIAIVNQSVGACWQDFFELKDYGQSTSRGRSGTIFEISEQAKKDFGFDGYAYDGPMETTVIYH